MGWWKFQHHFPHSLQGKRAGLWSKHFPCRIMSLLWTTHYWKNLCNYKFAAINLMSEANNIEQFVMMKISRAHMSLPWTGSQQWVWHNRTLVTTQILPNSLLFCFRYLIIISIFIYLFIEHGSIISPGPLLARFKVYCFKLILWGAGPVRSPMRKEISVSAWDRCQLSRNLGS